MSASSTSRRTLTGASADPPRLLGSLSRWASLCIVLIVIVAFFLIASEDWLTIVNDTLIAAIAALSLNVLSGYTGQISLGIAFFMAVGAYTAALLGGDRPTSSSDPLGLGLSFLIWLPAAGIVGPQGRTFPAPAFGDFSFAQQNDFFGLALTPGQEYFLLILPILGLSALFVGNVMRSRAGRAFQAVRDNEEGASIMGVNLFEAKMGAFILSSFLAGIAGALFASYSRYIVPNYWDLTLSIQFVAAIIVGGLASVWGSILGAAFVFALPLMLDQFSLLPPSSSSNSLSGGDLNALIYGLLIIAFLLFEPGGVVGLVHRWQKVVRKFNSHGGEGGEPAQVIDLAAPDRDAQLNIDDPTLPKSESR